jgi:hypothetical protein
VLSIWAFYIDSPSLEGLLGHSAVGHDVRGHLVICAEFQRDIRLAADAEWKPALSPRLL